MPWPAAVNTASSFSACRARRSRVCSIQALSPSAARPISKAGPDTGHGPIAAVRDGAGKSENRQAQGWETILAADSVDAEVRALVRPRPVPAMLWFLVSRLFRVIFRIFFRMQVRGAEKLPQGAFLICPNHQSFLDPAALISALPWRVFKNVFYVGTSEVFGRFAYQVTEFEVIDAAAQAALWSAGPGRHQVSRRTQHFTAGGKVTSFCGDAPKTVAISEWDSLEQAQAWFNSPARKNLEPQRDKAIKIVRQYAVEAAN